MQTSSNSYTSRIISRTIIFLSLRWVARTCTEGMTGKSGRFLSTDSFVPASDPRLRGHAREAGAALQSFVLQADITAIKRIALQEHTVLHQFWKPIIRRNSLEESRRATLQVGTWSATFMKPWGRPWYRWRLTQRPNYYSNQKQQIKNQRCHSSRLCSLASYAASWPKTSRTYVNETLCEANRVVKHRVDVADHQRGWRKLRQDRVRRPPGANLRLCLYQHPCHH
jgi:hypothetical protein